MKIDVTSVDGASAGSIELNDSIFGLDPRSDFLALLNLWRSWLEVRAERSASQARRWCRDNFLFSHRQFKS